LGTLGSTPKQAAVTHVPDTEPLSGDGALLMSQLELAYGSRAPAILALRRALVSAGRQDLPEAPSDLVAFVRARLVPILMVEIGPQLTMAIVDDLVADLAPISTTQPLASGVAESMPQPVARVALRSRSSVPPKAELSVLLVDPDRVWRSMLARDLVRTRWAVSVIDSADELESVVRPGEPIDVVIFDVLHPQAETIVDTVVSAFPTVVLVARASNGAAACSMLEEKGLHRFDVRPREAPAEELIEVVRRIVES
jgi:hypothetical protein